MEDCIVISDDEDIELIKHVVNLEPIVVDLTDTDDRGDNGSPTPSQEAAEPNQAHQEAADTNPPHHEAPMPDQPHHEAPMPDQPHHEAPMPDLSHHEAPQPDQPHHKATQPVPRPQTAAKPTTLNHEARINQRNEQYPQNGPVPAQAPRREDAMPAPPRQETAHPTMSNHEPKQTLRDPRTEFHHPNGSAPAQAPRQEAAMPVPPYQEAAKPTMPDHELMQTLKDLGNEKYHHNLFYDAIKIYKRASELANKLGDTKMSAILHFNLAMTYCKIGSFQQAADECANAVKIDEEYAKAHAKRGEIYERQNKIEEAVICYEYACDLDSSNQEYAKRLKLAKEKEARTGRKKAPLEILGLNPNFTHEDLKKAYRQKALSHHPDRHSNADIVTRKIEEKRFKEASEAYKSIQLKYGHTR